MEITIIFVTVFSLMYYCYRFFVSNNEILLLPIFYSTLVLYTILGCLWGTYSIHTPFNLYSLIKEEDVLYGAFLFNFAAFSFYLGSLTFKPNVNIVSHGGFSIKHQKTVIFFLLSLILIYCFGYGLEALFYRQGYIDDNFERNAAVLKLFFLLSPFFIVLIPFIESRLVNKLIYVVYFLVLFSASSRFVVMVPFLYVVGSYLKDKKLDIYVTMTNAFIILLSLLIVLEIRNNTYHGLIPNLSYVINNGVDLEFLIYGLNYAFSFSLFGLSFVTSNTSFSHDPVAFWIGLSPLPGRFYDMTLLESQRMLGTSPMSAMSILSLAGTEVLAIYYFLSGIVFSFILSKLKNVSILYYVVIGLFVIFSLFSVQYNLRGLSRFLYYSICCYGFFLFRMVFLKYFPKKRH